MRTATDMGTTAKQQQNNRSNTHTYFLGKGQGLTHPAELACSCSDAQRGRNASQGLVMSLAAQSRWMVSSWYMEPFCLLLVPSGPK